MKKIIISSAVLLGLVLNAQTTKVTQAKPSERSSKSKATTSASLSNTKVEIGQIITVQGQTLYGTARHYHMSVAELNALNPQLNGTLSLGQVVNIPKSLMAKYGNQVQPVATTYANKTEIKAPPTKVEEIQYRVQKGDTLFSIAKKTGKTISQLEKFNPSLKEEGLHPDMQLFLYDSGIEISKKENKTIAEATTKTEKKLNNPPQDGGNYRTYIVRSGDTLYGIAQRFNIGMEELLSLNPILKEGLKEGSQLRVGLLAKDYERNTSGPLRMTMILPFGVGSGNTKYRSIATDFMAGAKLALDRNVRLGKEVKLNIVDAISEEGIRNELQQIDLDATDVILGPLFKSNVIETVNYVKDKNIPVVAPFAHSKDLHGYSNLILMEVDEEVFAERIISEVEKIYTNQKIYILDDAKKINGGILKSILENKLKNARVVLTTNPSDIQLEKKISSDQSASTLVILATDNAESGLEYTQKLVELAKEPSIVKAFSMYYHPSFEQKENTKGLENADLFYIVDRKINTDGDMEQEILKAFKEKYCKTPTKYSIIGFDIMNDILMREDDRGRLQKNLNHSQTHLATKFDFIRTKSDGAFINVGYRVVRISQ